MKGNSAFISQQINYFRTLFEGLTVHAHTHMYTKRKGGKMVMSRYSVVLSITRNEKKLLRNKRKEVKEKESEQFFFF